MNHTKGPWTVRQLDCCDNDCAEYRIDELLEKVEALDTDSETYEADLKQLEAEGRANAQLIAAAPDLLGAIEETMHVLKDLEYDQTVADQEDKILRIFEICKFAASRTQHNG